VAETLRAHACGVIHGTECIKILSVLEHVGELAFLRAVVTAEPPLCGGNVLLQLQFIVFVIAVADQPRTDLNLLDRLLADACRARSCVEALRRDCAEYSKRFARLALPHRVLNYWLGLTRVGPPVLAATVYRVLHSHPVEESEARHV
jgi:hypothetical protein